MAGGNWVRWCKFQIFLGAAAGAFGWGEGPETAEGVVGEALPAGVRGPVERRALRRLAWIWAGVATKSPPTSILRHETKGFGVWWR